MKITLYWGVRNYLDKRPLQDLSDATYTASFDNCNFIANDGINTSLTVNVGKLENTPSTLIFPTYLVADDSTEWFVISAVKQRQGQLTLSLRRNLIAENIDDLQVLPFLCQRTSDIDNSVFDWARYIKATSMNEVKTSEFELKDMDGGKGWLIGYVNKDITLGTDEAGDSITSGNISGDLNSKNYDYLVDDNLSNWSLYNTSVRANTKITATWRCANSYAGTSLTKYKDWRNSINVSRGLTTPLTYDFDTYSGSKYVYNIGGTDTDHWLKAWNTHAMTMVNDIGKGLSTVITDTGTQLNTLIAVGNYDSYDGKILAVRNTTTNTLTRYRINVNKTTVSEKSSIPYSTMYNALQSLVYTNPVLRPFEDLENTSAAGSYGTVQYSYVQETISVTLLPSTTVSTYVRSNRVHCQDCIYDIFAIPLGGTLTLTLDNTDGSATTRMLRISNSPNMQAYIMTLVTALETTLGSQLIDLQWLPYGPSYEWHTQGSSWTEVNGYQWSSITFNNSQINAMCWLDHSQYTLSLNAPTDFPTLPTTNTELRIWNEEHKVRLVSPNYASQFEFSPVKNDGLTGFDIYMAYKPYSPYVRIAPKFSGLYGYSSNDARGLILSGDFSMDRLTDAWTQYKLQNKNYELIFNRQIQSMDLQNEYQDRLASQGLVQDIIGGISGTVQGISTGAMTGAMTTGGMGAIVGGVIGGVTSAAAGLTDTIVNQSNRKYEKAIRDDARDAAIDQFQYQLGNIKAMPDTITKVATFNPDYRIYPVLELYSCTQQDDANYRNAITWNGLEVNIQCTLSCASGFVQGTILRFDNMTIGASECKIINDELEGGIYL